MDIVLKRRWFISSKVADIKSEYSFLDEIGRGAYGKVYKCQHIESEICRAVKVIQKENVSDYNTFVTEIEILKNLDHPNIIKIIETFESDFHCYLVLEYYSGGDLFDRIIRQKRFSEHQAAEIMRSLFSAVMYCHQNKVCHRDLKPENCLCVSQDDGSDIKIIDFGLSKVSNEGEAFCDVQGSIYYIAPEVLEGRYTQIADCWSLGVILYMLLSGTLPFKGKDNQEIILNIYNAQVNFRTKTFKAISDSGKDLISRLLVKDPNFRLTAADAYRHEWVRGHFTAVHAWLPSNIITDLSRFVRSTNLKKAALMYFASKLDEGEFSELRQQFKNIDANGDGLISKEELQSAMNGFIDMNSDEGRQIMMGVDVNNNGNIDYTEFLTACLQTQNFTNKGLLKSAFKHFDKDNSGFISFQELKEVLEMNEINTEVDEKIENMLKEADTNQDGQVNYMEFLTMLSIKGIN